MKRSVHRLRGKAALTVGPLLLDRSDTVAKAPAGASGAARRSEAGFPEVVGEAKAAHDQLALHEAASAAAAARFKEKVAAALSLEKAADAEFGLVRARLLPEVKAGDLHAQALDDRLFPDGSTAFSEADGRPQVSVYDQWLAMAESEDVTANPAFAAIAAQVALFKPRHDAFSAAIREKEAAADALDAARAAQKASQETWTGAFRLLINEAAVIQGETSETFKAWIRPLLDWQAARAAQRTRRGRPSGANADAEPAPTEGDVEGDGDG